MIQMSKAANETQSFFLKQSCISLTGLNNFRNSKYLTLKLQSEAICQVVLSYNFSQIFISTCFLNITAFDFVVIFL